MAKQQFVSVPFLTGRELRRMLKLCGYTGRAFDRFLGRAADYSSKRLFPMRELPLYVSEALYLMVGHDIFWTAFHNPKVRGQQSTPIESVKPMA